ncbi:MAG: hypothetical protein HC890_07890 [Chloroflexaceae bacterium]|nr:hypothetical protein [Chloroflexaceae bacterium]
MLWFLLLWPVFAWLVSLGRGAACLSARCASRRRRCRPAAPFRLVVPRVLIRFSGLRSLPRGFGGLRRSLARFAVAWFSALWRLFARLPLVAAAWFLFPLARLRPLRGLRLAGFLAGLAPGPRSRLPLGWVFRSFFGFLPAWRRRAGALCLSLLVSGFVGLLLRSSLCSDSFRPLWGPLAIAPSDRP